MFNFVFFLGLLIFSLVKEGHCSSTTEGSPQVSVKDRRRQIEEQMNKVNTQLQPGQKQPPRANVRALPLTPSNVPNTTQAQNQKGIGKENQGQHQAQPQRPSIPSQGIGKENQRQHQAQPQRPSTPPQRTPPSPPVLRGGEARHGCQKVPPSGYVRILAIDGGGVRGLIPAIVIAQLEKDLGISITKIFDIFIGNSAGGMLALILTKPDVSQQKPAFTASQVVDMIKDLSAKIFGGVQETTLDKTKATLSKAKNLIFTGAQYSPEILEELTREMLETITISQALKPVFIATFDLNSESTQILSTPLAKRSKLFDFKMADIARATSAAPFYFPVHPLEFSINEKGTGLKMQLVDGGIGSNNPTLIGLMDVSKEYCTVPAYEVLSLGTGTAKHHFEKQDMTRKGSPIMMLQPTIGGLMSAQSQNADEATKEFLNVLNSFSNRQKSNYTRLQVYLEEEDKKLDDTRVQTTENLSQKAQEIIKGSKYQETVTRLKKQLCEEGFYKKENMHAQMCAGG